MARNVQYGRWQKVGLNVAVWSVFAATLGMAYYLGRHRGAGADVTFGQPERFDALTVRLIANAHHHTEPGPPRALVSEVYDDEGRLRRTVWVTCEQQGSRARGPDYYLESLLKVDVDSEPFDLLGRRGVIFAWRGIPEHYWFEPDPEKLKSLPKEGLYACAVLPDGLTVTVQVRGDGAYGPSSRQLLRAVADRIEVAGRDSRS
jgi:hypothetical protein